MDPNQNTNQNQGQNQVPVVSQQTPPVTQPVAPQTPPVQQPVAPPTVTPGGKESAPVTVQGEPQEYIQPAAHEAVPSVPEAVREAGVDVTPQQEQVKLSVEDEAAGLQAAKESTPLPTNNPIAVGFSSPMTLPQAETAAAGKANDSGTWLGKLVEFVFGQQPYKKDAQ